MEALQGQKGGSSNPKSHAPSAAAAMRLLHNCWWTSAGSPEAEIKLIHHTHGKLRMCHACVIALHFYKRGGKNNLRLLMKGKRACCAVHFHFEGNLNNLVESKVSV